MFEKLSIFLFNLPSPLLSFVIISLVIFLFVVLFGIIWLIRRLVKIIEERGLPRFSGIGYFIEPKRVKQEFDFGTVWEKEVKNSNNVVIGKIGFYKDLIIFRIFGEQWNSSTSEGIEGYKRFIDAFEPPYFLTAEQRSELNCFVFVNECRLQSRLIPIIKEKSVSWKKVYVVCTVSQYENNELNQIDNKLGLNLNIEIIKVPDIQKEVR